MPSQGREDGNVVRFARVIAAIVAGYLCAQVAVSQLDPRAGDVIDALVEATVIAVVSSVSLWFTVVRRLREQAESRAFETRVHDALQMGASEAMAYDVVARSVSALGVGGRTRLLLADSSEAHLKPAVDTVADPGHAPCTVVAPFDCPALRRAQNLAFPDVNALDCCPWLIEGQRHAGSANGASCFPLNVSGRSIGILQVTASARQLPRGHQVEALASVADQVGNRIGLLRVMEKTHLQAATDPLTGLLNRRSLENRAHELFRAGRPFSLAMGDLDHFKNLNDAHGHDAGDRALRVFARTLRGALRDDDIVARYGGEEFVIVLPGQEPPAAAAALERVREALALSVVGGTTPSFTVSFGVAYSADVDSLEDLVRAADAALFRAKRDGRNRVVVDSVAQGSSATHASGGR